MRRFQLAAVAVCSLTLWMFAARPAAADRPTCDDIQSARETGRTVEAVADDFGVTRARVTACERLAEQRARHEEQRAETAAFRAQRGLP
jgi:hypothetical protein